MYKFSFALLKVHTSYGTRLIPLIYKTSLGIEGGSLHCGTRGVNVGELPCIVCYGRTVGHEELTLTVKADLSSSLLYLRNVSFYPALDFGDSATKIQ